METLIQKIENEINDTKKYYDDDFKYFEIEPIDERENKLFDSGYIYALKFVLRTIKFYNILRR